MIVILSMSQVLAELPLFTPTKVSVVSALVRYAIPINPVVYVYVHCSCSNSFEEKNEEKKMIRLNVPGAPCNVLQT